MPHLQRAMRMQHELEECRLRQAAALEGLNRQGTAAIVTDGAARVIFANRTAEGFLKAGDGILASAGRLTATTAQSSARLLTLIAHAGHPVDEKRPRAGAYIALPRSDRKPLTALICTIPPQTDGLAGAPPAVLLLFRDPEMPFALPVQAFCSLFGLSTAEARLMASLAEGRAIDDIAAEMRISEHTARTQLKNVMAKTSTSRRGELIALVLRSIPAAS
jgi:DNA-binding CsgD family transcriptional regulator